ncbi:MAG: hypothetical protein IIB08_03415, partial [Bacteroidetes bacterium]|nr:hypothetical protein [Bacteroidota bacterium]
TGGDGNDYFFDGSIDEVRIYSRVLSADEVAKLYDDGNHVVTCTDSDGGLDIYNK